MRKILMKFCDDRKKELCIKTIIWQDGDKKSVTKEAIFLEGNAFLKEILSYPEQMQYAYPEVEICPVKWENGVLVFDFIQGDDFEKFYSDAMMRGERENFKKLLKKHVALIEGAKSNHCTFHNSEYFERFFGDGDAFDGSLGLKISNYDATASNIIFKKNKPVFIDYEWLFLQPIPRDLVVYHCIRESYEHINGLENFFSLKESLALLECNTNLELLEKTYWYFFNYLNLEEFGLSFSEKKNGCLKKTEETKDFVTYKNVLEAELVKCLNVNRQIESYWCESAQAAAQLNTELQNCKEGFQKNLEDKAQFYKTYETIRSSKMWKVAKKIKNMGKK